MLYIVIITVVLSAVIIYLLFERGRMYKIISERRRDIRILKKAMHNVREKYTPKQVMYDGDFYCCPNCHDESAIIQGDSFCSKCGQALDWR